MKNSLKLSPVYCLPYREAKAQILADFQAAYCGMALRRSAGNISAAARESGLERSNFRRIAARAEARASKAVAR